jgi:hypothetical protein
LNEINVFVISGVSAASANEPAPALLPFKAAGDHLFLTYARKTFGRQVIF